MPRRGLAVRLLKYAADTCTDLSLTCTSDDALVLLGLVEVELLGASELHGHVKDGELTRGERADHDAPSAEASQAQLLQARLLGKVDQSRHNRARAAGGGRLVNLGQQCVRGVRNDGGGDARERAGAQRDGGLAAVGCGLHVGASGLRDHFLSPPLHGELRHRVRHLLEQDGAKAGVEALEDAVVLDDLGERGQQAECESPPRTVGTKRCRR